MCSSVSLGSVSTFLLVGLGLGGSAGAEKAAWGTAGDDEGELTAVLVVLVPLLAVAPPFFLPFLLFLPAPPPLPFA